MNYYPFHIGDYLSHTAHLTPLEDIAYRRLLDVYYLNESPLPVDPTACARLVRMREHLDEVKAVLDEFFVKTDAAWVNERCDAEIFSMRDKQDKARASAAASVAARQAKAERLESERKADAERPLNERSTDVELPTPTPTPTPDISTSLRSVDSASEKRVVKRAAQIPEDFTPNEVGLEYALKRGIDVHAEIVAFGNWHRAKGSTMKDWQAAWRTWCDKAVEFGRAATPGKVQFKTARQINDEATARALFGSRMPVQEKLITGEVIE